MSRERLDRIDHALVELLAERDRTVAALWSEKERLGVPLRDPAREAQIFAHLRERATISGLDPACIERIFHEIVGRRLGP